MIASVNGVSFADYLSAIRSGNTQHANVIFPNQSVTITDHKINESGIEYQLLLNSAEDITLNLTPCAMVHMYLMNYDGSLSSIDYTDEFTVDFGVDVPDSSTPPVYTNVPQVIGHFIGQKPQKVNQRIIELTGYDRMILFETPADGFFQQEATGRTAGQYFMDLCTYVGVPYKVPSNNIPNITRTYAYHPTNGYGRTCRQVLGLLAEAMGCYARIAMDGECELVTLVDHKTDYTIVRRQQMVEPDIAEYTVPVIDKLQVKSTEDDIGVIIGTGTNAYTVVDNPFLYGVDAAEVTTYAQGMYSYITANLPAYIPVTVQVDGSWLVEPGDIVKLELEGGSTMDFPIFNVAMVWTGNANIVYETTGLEHRQELTLENQQKLQEGQKFHNLIMSIDTLVSEIGDRTGKLTTITQDIDHLELIAQNTAHVFVMLTDPALTEVVNDGDLWIRQEFESWQDILDNVNTWGDLDNGQRTWATIYSEEVYVRKDNHWVRVTMNAETLSNVDGLREKYDIQSGIEIKPEGVEIKGGKYIHMEAGSDFKIKSGTFDVDSENFKVSSEDKLLKAGQWQFDDDGINVSFTDPFDEECIGYFKIADGLLTLGVEVPIYSAVAKAIIKYGSYRYQGQLSTVSILQTNVVDVTEVWAKDIEYTNLHQTSSRDIKHDIQPMPSKGEQLDALKPVTFVYDDDPNEKTRYGLIYEDTIEIMPEICTGDESEKAINYVELIPMLLKEIQELRARVKVLEEREGN